jgi:hypothetical protein
MNAYELADELQDLHGLYCEDAANMLRQQANRIAELEKLVSQRFDDGKRLGVLETEDRFRTTPQIKELSDEEINETAQQCWVYPQGEQAIFNQHKFARAILKKASEK